MKLKIHIDGGSRGNPGPAGAGVAIRDESDRPVLEAGFFLGRMTNNMAEYHGLVRALEHAESLAPTEVRIISDSELLVRQLNGEYRVRNENLRDLFDSAMARLKRIGRWKIEHVRREHNQRADELANLAMDAGEDVIEIGVTASDFPGESRPKLSRSAAPHHVTARCISGASPSVCPAPCHAGNTLTFEKITPGGICLGLAADLLKAVHAAESTGRECQAGCPRDGCGAAFVVVRV